MSDKKQPKPDISIIVPAFNASKTIRRCLKSIFKITTAKVETIVVDDGSSDDTCILASSIYHPKNHTITIIPTRNQGVSSARNLGLQLAKGHIIAFVDSDDTILASNFASLCNQLHKSDCDVAIGGVHIFFNQSVTRQHHAIRRRNFLRITQGRCIHTISIRIRLEKEIH